MGSLIFSITKLKIKLKTFKPQELAKNETWKTTLNLNTIISLHQILSRQGPGRIQQVRSRGGDIHEGRQWFFEKAFCRPMYVTRSKQAHVSFAHSMSLVMCYWNTLHKNKWSSSAFKWNSWIWNRIERMGTGQWHPYYMEGAGKDGKRNYSGCIKDIHSELPLSHQSQGGSSKQKCEYLIHT